MAANKAVPPSKDFVTVTNGVITFTNTGGEYTIDFLNKGQIKVLYNNSAYVVKDPVGFDAASFGAAKVTVLTPGEVNLVNIGFNEAGPSSGFEPTVNLNALIEKALGTSGAAWPAAIDNFVETFDVNGGDADTIKLLWDYLDDNYVTLNNYYANSVNEAFVRLGVEYVKYLNNGGKPLTDITAKFAADGGDAGSAPDRVQSMHDNLLGNITEYSITQRNFPNAAELKALVASAGGGYLNRIDASGLGAFSGNESDLGGAAHDQARAFDWDKGFERTDWLDTSFDGVTDSRTHDPAAPSFMIYGDGNPVNDFNIVRHEGAQVELALKIKHFGGSAYDEVAGSTEVTQGGISADYHVETGASSLNANRAEWSFDWSAVNYGDETVKLRLLVDGDPTAAVDYNTWIEVDADASGQLQDSWNIGFNFLKPSGYAYGEGQFDIRLEAVKDGQVIAHNQATVFVDFA